MKQEELFEIFDAMHPSVEDIRAYLEKMCRQIPLPLLCEGGAYTKWSDLANKKENFFGVLLDEETMLYLRALSFDDAKDCDEFSIDAWINEHFTLFPSRAATQQDISKIKENRSKLEETFAILDYHGIKTPNIGWGRLDWLKQAIVSLPFQSAVFTYMARGNYDFPILSTYTDNLLVKLSVREGFFKPART